MILLWFFILVDYQTDYKKKYFVTRDWSQSIVTRLCQYFFTLCKCFHYDLKTCMRFGRILTLFLFSYFLSFTLSFCERQYNKTVYMVGTFCALFLLQLWADLLVLQRCFCHSHKMYMSLRYNPVDSFFQFFCSCT